jgi:hypothetical protein
MCTVCLRYGRKGDSEMSKDGTKLIEKAIPAPVEIHALQSNTMLETSKPTNHKQHG